MKSNTLSLLVVCLTLAACGAEPDTATANGTPQASSPTPSAVATSKSTSFITASLSGAVAGKLQGNTALSGAEYERYHLNFAGTLEGLPGTIVIAFGREDTSSPAAGTYALGANADFSGSVEFYADDRDFDITSGELVISKARGDSLSGTFSLRATEAESKTSIETEGSFQTRPAN